MTNAVQSWGITRRQAGQALLGLADTRAFLRRAAAAAVDEICDKVVLEEHGRYEFTVELRRVDDGSAEDCGG